MYPERGMHKKKMISLQVRLVYSFILSALIAILIAGLLIIFISLRIFNNRESEHLDRIAIEVSGELENSYMKGRQIYDLSYALSSYGLRNNVALRLEDPDGTVAAESYTLSDNPDLSLSSSMALPLLPVVRKELDFNPLEGYSLIVLRFDEYFFHPASLLFEGILFATVLTVIISIFIGRFIGRKIAKPIIELSSVAVSISNEDWNVTIPESNSLELSELTGSLDSMREQLSVSFHTLENERDVMKRFLQDASHQLRTPLTALNTFLELLQSDHPHMAEKKSELLEDSQHQVEKLSRIVQDLMELTRIESDLSLHKVTVCSVKDSCRKAWKGLQGNALEKELFLDLSGPAGSVKADPHRLEMALSNVLDNAVKWSPQGGRITVRISLLNKKVELRISDQGTGLPDKDLERIFERFYQSSPRKGGSGLGLAVVKRIVEDAGGSVSAGNNENGGAWFKLVYPMAEEPGTIL